MIKGSCQVLNLGCGNSLMCEKMYDEGYQQITNNDISKICIQNMLERNERRRPDMKWEVIDIKDMSTYANNSFDLVIDKSTIDAILCGNAPYIKKNYLKDIAKILKECQRILKPGGSLISISTKISSAFSEMIFAKGALTW